MQQLSTIGTAEIDVRSLCTPHGGHEHVNTIDDAYAWCGRLARSHYENFPVASLLVPASIRRHFFSVYAISRLGDDVADEAWTDDPSERLSALSFLDDAVDGLVDPVGNPILWALRHTISECGIPAAPFHRLFEAFRRDVSPVRPTSWEHLLEYCSYSANPVGELILHLAGHPTQDALHASNAVCTALQITNFIQDQSRDLAIGREYLPIPVPEAIRRTRILFLEGRRVVAAVSSWRMKLELRMIIAAGMTMLDRCEGMIDQLQYQRPALRKSDYFRIAVSALFLRTS